MPAKPITENTLFYGDNLNILREYIPDESVDLVYLDPPFNSSRNYNVLFRDESGEDSEAQIEAFKDTWHWVEAAPAYHALMQHGPTNVAQMIEAMRAFVGANQLMAYLVMMTTRLIELHRVLKPTGSLYLHCDPTASHYLKIVLDTIMGTQHFRNEVIWKRTSAHSDTKQGAIHMGRIHDVIFFYTKSDSTTRNAVHSSYDESYVEKFYKYTDPNGRRYTLDNLTGPGGARKGNPSYEFLGVTRYWRYSKENMQRLYEEGRIIQKKTGAVPRYKRYLDEMPGVSLQDVWDDIPPIGAQAAERMGYPTQKPIALLERIVKASSNPGDVVLDPFAGCGTTVVAAQGLDRRWIGIDITTIATTMNKFRLKTTYPDAKYEVIGLPKDLQGARALAQENRYSFQWWALGLVEAQPLGGEPGAKTGKKGADRGIDGLIRFVDEAGDKYKRVLIQVKSGHVKSGDIRDLRGTVEREKASLGVFITLEEPSREMKIEAMAAGFYHSPGWNRDFPVIQMFTVSELMAGAKIEMPPQRGTLKQAPLGNDPRSGSQPNLL